jgi:hypothetical protein
MRVRNASRVLACVQNVADDLIQAHPVFHLRENEGAAAAHLLRIPIHHGKIGADRGREVGLVDHQQIGLGDSRAPFARDFVPARDVDDLDRIIRQLATEACGQIVATGFEQQYVRTEAAMKLLKRHEVGGNILANRSVRTTARLDRANALRCQSTVVHEEFAVFLGENVVGHCSNIQAISQALAELEHERGLTAPHRSPDANGKRALLEVPVKRQIAFMKMAGMLHVFVGMTLRVIVAVTMRMAVGMGVGMGVHG